MAGNFPDMPRRIAYDRDGTLAVYINPSNVLSNIAAFSVGVLNDEADSFFSPPDANNFRIALIFPDLRDLVGLFWSSIHGAWTADTVEWSANTTTGLDGAWSVASGAPHILGLTPTSPTYRTGVTPISLSGVRGIRFNHLSGGPADVSAIHLYGTLTPGQTLDRLRIWDPHLSQEADGVVFDFGNAPRHSSADKTFRVKNISNSATANGVTISVETLSDSSPSVVPQLLFSDDGVNFTQTLSIGSLAPGAVSGRYTLRRVTPANAQLGAVAFRVVATAESFS